MKDFILNNAWKAVWIVWATVLIVCIGTLLLRNANPPKSNYVITARDGKFYVNDFKWNEKQTCVVFEDIEQKRAVECGDFQITSGRK